MLEPTASTRHLEQPVGPHGWLFFPFCFVCSFDFVCLCLFAYFSFVGFFALHGFLIIFLDMADLFS